MIIIIKIITTVIIYGKETFWNLKRKNVANYDASITKSQDDVINSVKIY